MPPHHHERCGEGLTVSPACLFAPLWVGGSTGVIFPTASASRLPLASPFCWGSEPSVKEHLAVVVRHESPEVPSGTDLTRAGLRKGEPVERAVRWMVEKRLSCAVDRAGVAVESRGGHTCRPSVLGAGCQFGRERGTERQREGMPTGQGHVDHGGVCDPGAHPQRQVVLVRNDIDGVVTRSQALSVE